MPFDFSQRFGTKLTIALGLVTLGTASMFSGPFFEKPILPPHATGNEPRFPSPAGFSIAFPHAWTANNHRMPSCCKALTYAHPAKRDSKSPVMRVEIVYPLNSDITVKSFRPYKTSFLNRDAILRAGRISTGLAFWENIKRVWKKRSLRSWKPGKAYASWTLEFEQGDERVTLRYTAACGLYTRIDPATIPPEVMSYFETFESTLFKM